MSAGGGNPIAGDATEVAIERLEPLVRAVSAPILLSFAVLGVYAALELRGLFADGSHYLLEMMRAQGFHFVDAPRRVTYLLQQLPAVLAMRLGVTDAHALAALLGLAMHLVPLAFVTACYWLLPRGKKAYFVFPLFHYLAGSEAAAFAGIAEAPMASAYFWFLLYLIVFRRPSPLALALAALPAMYLHEAFLFLAPVLALASVWRAQAEPDRPARILYGVLAVWFLLIAGMEIGYIIDARDPQNRNYFILEMLGFGFLMQPVRIGFTVGGINVPAALGLLAAGAGWLGWRIESRTPERRRLATFGVIAGFGVLCAVLVAGSAVSDYLFAPTLQFRARTYGAVLSLPLAGLFLLSLRRPTWHAIWARPANVAVLLVLALGQLGWHTLGTWYWSRYVADFETILRTHRGLVPWPEATASVPPERSHLLGRLSWYWTNPTLSMILAPHGEVAALIDNPVSVRWQPFDPADPAALPMVPHIDTSRYREALAEAKKAARQ